MVVPLPNSLSGPAKRMDLPRRSRQDFRAATNGRSPRPPTLAPVSRRQRIFLEAPWGLSEQKLGTLLGNFRMRLAECGVFSSILLAPVMRIPSVHLGDSEILG